MNAQLADETETIAWGQQFASGLRQGDVMLLFGPLGAGKTTLVRGIAAGLGYTGQVLSPTFTILEIYEGRLPVYHFDFYRIDEPSELRAVDPREYFDAGVTVIEWPERIRALWPPDRIEVTLSIDSPGRRLQVRKVPAADA